MAYVEIEDKGTSWVILFVKKGNKFIISSLPPPPPPRQTREIAHICIVGNVQI